MLLTSYLNIYTNMALKHLKLYNIINSDIMILYIMHHGNININPLLSNPVSVIPHLHTNQM